MNDNVILDSNTLKKIINKLPNKCSNDPDGMTNVSLKKLSNSICIPLAMNFS